MTDRDHEPTDDARVAENLAQNRFSWSESDYYDVAEDAMDMQWSHIFPMIRDADFTSVLELAPGHGRNTLKLMEVAGEIHLVDLNATCIEYCRQRFAGHAGPCRLSYHVNDGTSLPMLADGSISFVYSFDAMVHFDRDIVRDYVREFARVMRPGARGFVHYSNYGQFAEDPDSNWRQNPHWRSTMSRALFAEFCAEAGLEVVQDRLVDWEGVPQLDCVTVFAKPA